MESVITLLWIFGMATLGVTFLLAIAPAIFERSVLTFFRAAFLVVTGMLLPLIIFLLSALLVVPLTAFGGFGWLSLFHFGKLALTPLVLWALAAFYDAQVLNGPGEARPWVALGLFAGAIISAGSTVLAFLVHLPGLEAWLLVPVATTAWYGWLAWRTAEPAGLRYSDYERTLDAFVPFAVLGLLMSYGCLLLMAD